jgi:uric acid transporter
LLESGILLCAIVSVTLNQFFNGFGSAKEARTDAIAAATSSEHV